MNHAQHIADDWLEGWANKFRKEAEYYKNDLGQPCLEARLNYRGPLPPISLAVQYVAKQLNECVALLEGARIELLTNEQLTKE